MSVSSGWAPFLLGVRKCPGFVGIHCPHILPFIRSGKLEKSITQALVHLWVTLLQIIFLRISTTLLRACKHLFFITIASWASTCTITNLFFIQDVKIAFKAALVKPHDLSNRVVSTVILWKRWTQGTERWTCPQLHNISSQSCRVQEAQLPILSVNH